MSFRIGGNSKSGSISLGGFSFKQLEEDEEEEEVLSVCTGKYDKVLEHSQKSSKRNRESTLSTSSNSSTSSTSSEVKIADKKTSDVQNTNKEISKHKKSVHSESVEVTSSPFKKQAKAKLESSKELFSGLRGKITDKISKTIEEFSSDSSSNPSPDNEKLKEVPDSSERSSEIGPVVSDSTNLLHSATPVEQHPLVLNNEDEFNEDEETLSAEIFRDPEEDTTSVASAESSVDVNELVFQDVYTNEPSEDFTGTPAFSTATQVKPKSKIKRLMHKNARKTSAITSLSALASLPDRNAVPSSSHPQKLEKHEESKVLSNELSVKSNPSMSKPLNLMEFSEMPFYKFAAIIVVIFAYMIFPLPSYFSGFIMGSILSSFGFIFFQWINKPQSPVEPIPLPPVQDLPPPPVPQLKQTTTSDEIVYKGWMNEVVDYKPDDYHISKTYSVFISLEGTHLRLQRPKNPAPKRAMWDENITKPQFIHQRHFDMSGSRVFLFPFGLVKKRIWSKKYPICIALADVVSGSEMKESTDLKHTSSEPLLDEKVKEKSSDSGFEIITHEKVETILYLFARTGREKEDWFKRFSAAASGRPLGNHVFEIQKAMKQNPYSSIPRDLLSKAQKEEVADVNKSSTSTEEATYLEGSELLSFAMYMGRLMPKSSAPSSRGSTPTHITSKLPGGDKEETPKYLQPGKAIDCDNQLSWLNALIGRSFFDFLRDKWWIGKVTEKLQRKLSKIHVPYFIEELQVTSIDMGYEIPAIRHAGSPYLDEHGFWVDLDMTYSGGFKMTIETKMNLMKLKKSPHASHSQGHSVDGSKSAITDSDEEDSAESSTDEEEETPTSTEESSSTGGGGGGGGTSKKFLRYLNKITQSRYFQQATEYKVIRRAMENVSNTPLTLTVTVNSLVGKLALNIPPPPSDRLWYGFRGNPHLRLSAKPQVGERAVTFTHVTEWIEKKLAIEFQRVIVMPNMDDLVIPILVPVHTNQRTMSRSASL